MTNIFICIMFAAMFAQYFYINMTVQTLNYVVENLPMSYIEENIYLDNSTPYFNQEGLEDQVYSYYESMLSSSLYDHTDLKFTYYSGGDIRIVDPDEKDGIRVEITLNNDFSSLYKYSKTMYYEIVEGLAHA